MLQIVENTSPTGHEESYDRLQVKRPSGGPRFLRRWSWRLHACLLPLLHYRDPAQPQDVDVNLRILWNKALIALDSRSPVYERGRRQQELTTTSTNKTQSSVTFDLLPTWSRSILRILPTWLFPRWFHAVIELRTVYLDRAIRNEIINRQEKAVSDTKKIRLITMGGGYDGRSLRFLESQQIQQAYELDIPSVVTAKTKMLERFKERRGYDARLPTLVAIDLNNVESVQSTIQNITKNDRQDEWHSILVCEGIFLYLDKGVPGQVLQTFAHEIHQSHGSASLCLADGLEDVPRNDKEGAAVFLSQCGWNLVDW